MKINRRDYLKQIGAAGMLASVTGLEGLAQENEPQQCPPGTDDDPSRAPRVWDPAWYNDLPNHPYVRVIFYGLIGIAPRRLAPNKVECDVGFHRKGESPLSHQLHVAEYNGRDFQSKADTKIEKLALHVANPVFDQTYFYQRGTACTRRQLKDDKDFRWIVDFESDYLYKTPLTKKESVYAPVLNIKSGIFYTLHKTASTFVARSDDNRYFCDMAHIADYIAVNVYVKSGGVEVKINENTSFTVEPPGQILIKNHCMNEHTNDKKCKFKPYDDDKEERSDFFLNYKAFDRKGKPEYHLHLLERNYPARPHIESLNKEFAKMTPEEITSSDESPCSAAGYGRKYTGLP